MRMMVRKLMLDLYDLNRDHILDPGERLKLLEDAERSKRECALRLAERFDHDQDGRLSPEEEEALRAHVEERWKSRKELPDLIKEPEGSLCTVPLPPPPHHHCCPGCRSKAPHPHRKAPPSFPKEAKLIAFISGHLIMAAYDDNGDGILDESESRKLTEDGQWLYDMREKALLDAYDENRDGFISRDELKHALLTILFPDAAAPDHDHKRPPLTPLDRMLDTRFDADILLHLSQRNTSQPAASQPQ